MSFNKISSTTKDVLNSVEEKVQKQSASLDKKIAQLKTDFTAAKKHKLSKTAQNSLEKNLKNMRLSQKNLLKSGIEQELKSEVDKKSLVQEKIVKDLIKKVDVLLNYRLNKTAFKLLSELSGIFKKTDDKEQKVEKVVKQSNPHMSSAVAELVVILEIFEIQKNMFKEVETKLSGVKIASADNISVNDQYPLIRTRARLAQLCVESARGEWLNSVNHVDTLFEGMAMMSMFLSDARNHYNLGVQILHGSPQSIESARSMDTASRDGIDEDVWDFASEKIYENNIFGAKALKVHRQKVLEQNAQKLNAKIQKEIGVPQARKAARRKI